MLAYAAARPSSVLAFDATHFRVTVDGNQVAGEEFDVTVEALLDDNNVDPYYEGTVTLSGNLSNSPSGDAPSFGDDIDLDQGVGTGHVTAYAAEGPVHIEASDGSIFGQSVNFGVSPGLLAKTLISPSNESVNADIGYVTYSLEAFDAYGNARDPGTVTFGITPENDVTTQCTGADCGSRKTGGYTVADTGTGYTAGSTGLTVTPGALHHFTFDEIGTQTAGESFSVSITAYDAWGNVKTDYDGTAVLSGLNDSPGCTACTPDIPAASPTYGTLDFDQGVATASVTAFDAGTASIVVTDADEEVSDTSNSFDVAHAPTLGDFSIDPVSTPKDAGSAFAVTVRAYDPYGNVYADYDGGSLGGLTNSPGCASPDCSPALVATTPNYGSGSWSNGVKVISGVKAHNAQTDAAVTYSDGALSETSNQFVVRPLAAKALLFSYAPRTFDGQPIDTEIGDKVYHVCSPAAPSAADPCLSSSPPVQVLALDLYGNLALPTLVSVKVNNTGSAYTGTTVDGIASITSPTAPVAPGTSGSFSLTASASGAASKVSNSVQAVNDLEACVGATCDNGATNQASNKQSSFGKIFKGEANFGGANPVTLQTQYLAFDNGQCGDGSAKTVGQTTEIKTTGTGVTATAPDFSLVLVYPKNTIKNAGYTSRGPDGYNICLGATWIGDGTPSPWLAKSSLKKGAPLVAATQDPNNANVYWGYLPECSDLTAAQRETNPCISLRTKQAATLRAAVVPNIMSASDFTTLGMKDADIAIVISKPFPWDGKMGLK
jgi:hypothetical protein